MQKQEEKFKVVEAWKQSGLSAQKYAVQIGMPYATLQYWAKRYRLANQQTAEPSGRFIALEAPKQPRHIASPSGIVITLPSGTRIEVH